MKITEKLVATSIALVACITLFLFSEMRAKNSLSDFSAYWTACRLFTQNPYSPKAVNSVQEDLAANRNDLLVMRNPPWTALVFFPLSVFSYPVATGLWTVISVLLIFGCSLYFWRRLGGKDDMGAFVIAFTFAPTFLLIDLGQITALLLAGAALFVYAIDKERLWVAGAALLPFTFKPHLTILPLVAVFAWAIVRRRWTLLCSFGTTLLAFVALCFLINKNIGSQYLRLLTALVGRGGIYDTLGGILSSTSGLSALRFLPLLAGLVFVLTRLARAKQWDWFREFPLILAIGVAASIYSYAYDEVLALPLMFMAFLSGNKRVFAPLFVVVNATIFLFAKFPEIGTWWWSATAWLAIYAASMATRSQPLATGVPSASG